VRVVYVTPDARPDHGWGRYAREVAASVRRLGVEPVLVTATSDRDERTDGIEYHPILPPLFARRFETPRSLFATPRLRRVLAGCDVVHCVAEPYAPLVALSCPRGVPFVLTGHGTWAIRPLERPAGRALFRSAFRRAVIVFQTEFTRDWMARLMRLPPHVVAPGGVHPETFASEEGPALPGWAGRDPLVLTVGAVKPRKGHLVTLDAVARARSAVPNLRWVVIGKGADRLLEAVATRGMATRVHLLGQVPFPELVRWYRRADVFALLPVNEGASFEGFGLVYLEAAAAGTPAIGTRDCGAGEAIVDGVTGLVVPQRDPEAAAAALVRLLTDGGLRERMGAAGRARARELSWTRLAERLVALYGDLLAEERRPLRAGRTRSAGA
jgi:glycosyltransferase involved in cell wall biosynthesis